MQEKMKSLSASKKTAKFCSYYLSIYTDFVVFLSYSYGWGMECCPFKPLPW